MGHTTTKQTYPFSTKKKKTHSLVSESQTHNKHEPSRRAQGPKTQNEKTERREAKWDRKKKKKNPLGDSDFRFRTEASERRGRESESLRDVPAARRRRRSSCRGSVCDGKVRAE